MPATLDVSCPNCGKALKLPAALAGKTLRCKNCQATFQVPAAGGPPTPAKPAKPAGGPDAPIPFKADPPPEAARSRYADADDDDDANPYAVVKDEAAEAPRCPFCAKELDPPDTKICLNCGYDMTARRRHETKAVYAPTPAEYAAHLAPGIACAVAVVVVAALDILCFLKMRSWMEGGMLQEDSADAITGQKKFLIPPYCFNLWIGMISLVVLYLCSKFAIKRLVHEWRPEERKIQKEDD